MEKFAECVQDSEQLKSALLEMQVSSRKWSLAKIPSPPPPPRELTGISHKRVYMNHPKSRQALTSTHAALEFLFFAAFGLLRTDTYILISFTGVLLLGLMNGPMVAGCSCHRSILFSLILICDVFFVCTQMLKQKKQELEEKLKTKSEILRKTQMELEDKVFLSVF